MSRAKVTGGAVMAPRTAACRQVWRGVVCLVDDVTVRGPERGSWDDALADVHHYAKHRRWVGEAAPSMGQVAYEAYCARGTLPPAADMLQQPPWPDLTEPTRARWDDVAAAVLEASE